MQWAIEYGFQRGGNSFSFLLLISSSIHILYQVPTNDEVAEGKIAAAYASDPGASPNGKYVPTDEAIKDSINYPNLRFMVVGNKHVCSEPIEDFFPSPYAITLNAVYLRF